MIEHFTVVCFVAWPLNENEAGGDLVLIETSLLFTGAQPKAGTGHKMQTGVWKTRIVGIVVSSHRVSSALIWIR